MSKYQKQAEDFLAATGTEFKAEFARHDKYFDSDDIGRDIYRITLKRGHRCYSFDFGQSINNSLYMGEEAIEVCRKYGFGKRKPITIHEARLLEIGYVPAHGLSSSTSAVSADPKRRRIEPTAYDVLANLTKNNPGSFEEFCAELGYDTDSRRAERTYNAVVQEWLQVSSLFTAEEIEKLQEIN